MAMITSIRAPVPVAEIPRQPDSVAALDKTVGFRAGTAPVSPPDAPLAAVQVFGRPAATDTLLDPAANTTETRAAEAAEAARKAYIEASFAAGINPLPLP